MNFCVHITPFAHNVVTGHTICEGLRTVGIKDRVWGNRTLTFCNSALDYFYEVVDPSLKIFLSSECIYNTKNIPRPYL